NARQQFADSKRFGYIIIRAKIQADDFVNLLAFGRQHKDWRADFLRAKLLADIVSAQTREHHIEDDQSGLLLLVSLNGLVAAAAYRHLERFAFQHLFESQRNVWVVFNDQDFRFHIRVYWPVVLSSPSTGSLSTKQLPPLDRA